MVSHKTGRVDEKCISKVKGVIDDSNVNFRGMNSAQPPMHIYGDIIYVTTHHHYFSNYTIRSNNNDEAERGCSVGQCR